MTLLILACPQADSSAKKLVEWTHPHAVLQAPRRPPSERAPQSPGPPALTCSSKHPTSSSSDHPNTKAPQSRYVAGTNISQQAASPSRSLGFQSHRTQDQQNKASTRCYKNLTSIAPPGRPPAAAAPRCCWPPPPLPAVAAWPLHGAGRGRGLLSGIARQPMCPCSFRTTQPTSCMSPHILSINATLRH